MAHGTSSDTRKSIIAAGAVVLRTDDDGPKVLVVHRPHHEDWSLPKGKLEPGESPDVAAVREVLEETGVAIHLGLPLPDVHYEVTTKKGTRPKTVHWWIGIPTGDDATERTPDGEVDHVVWLPIPEALDRLTYPDDRDLVERAAAAPTTTALIVQRHAKALSRKEWGGPDDARPLAPEGVDEAATMTARLACRGPQRLISSPAWRCVTTLLDLASLRHLTIERHTTLTEPEGTENPQRVRTVCSEWVRQVSQTRTVTVLCGHRPVLPDMLAGFEIPEQPFDTAQAVIAHLRTNGSIVTLEHLRP